MILFSRYDEIAMADNEDAALRNELMDSIKRSLEDALKKNASKRDLNLLKIRLEHAGEKKAIKVRRPVSYKALKNKINDMFKKSLTLYYTVPNSELIVPIQSQEDLENAIALVDKSDRMRSLRLICSTFSVDTEPSISERPSNTGAEVARGVDALSPSNKRRFRTKTSSSRGSDSSFGFQEVCASSTGRSTSSQISADSASFCSSSGGGSWEMRLGSKNSHCSDTSDIQCRCHRKHSNQPSSSVSTYKPGCTPSNLRRKNGSSSSSSGFVADLSSASDCPECRSRKESGVHSALSPKAPLNWRLGKSIGCGAFGQVFVCYDADTGRELAVKKVNINSNDWQQTKEVMALENEIRLLRNLQHERIVQYLGCQKDDTNHSLCIFMEYLPGGSVKNEIKQYGPLTEPVVKKYVRQILEGLQYLHNYDIIHRDIKTANILRDAQGNVKIGDFGSGKRLQVICSASTMGTFIGTPHYMAPEVINGQKYGRRADIWSLGCCIVEMFTGSPPWQEFEPMAAILKIATQRPTYELPQDIDDRWTELLSWMFASEPGSRCNAQEALSHDLLL